MWSFVLSVLLLRVSGVFGENVMEYNTAENQTSFDEGLQTNVNNLKEIFNEVRIKQFGSFLSDLVDWTKSGNENVEGKSRAQTVLGATEDGRKLKYKKTELKFLMKLLIILKVVLGLVLPLGIIASKILSWKAVTLSLMAFMLAKILFVKNLLTGKNAYPVVPTNIVPPFSFHGATNDVFWKRQGDVQNVYPWNST